MRVKVVQILTVFLALAALAGFALIFGQGIKASLPPKNPGPHLVTEEQNGGQSGTDPLIYVATALAALVGGIVAVTFGVESTEQQPTKKTPFKDWLTAAYAVTYVLFGVAAVAVWVVHPTGTVELVRNLATTFLGLALPIVTQYFRWQEQQRRTRGLDTTHNSVPTERPL
ncbi:MAG: hypothetical protein EHM23_10770 [Acidobacteria bacterium]|nr:MAG: hypothetical protein EHM23_10770 [Acidobacteriota bacterium]